MNQYICKNSSLIWAVLLFMLNVISCGSGVGGGSSAGSDQNTTPAVTFENTMGGNDFDAGTEILQTTDGDYIIVGTTKSYGAGESDIYLLRITENGNVIWGKTSGGALYENGYAVDQTSDGGFIIAGDTNSFSNNYQVYLIKTDSSGDTLWDKTFGGTNLESAKSVQQTADGGYIIAGYTTSFGINQNVYLVKTDIDGNMEWQNDFGGTDIEWGESVQQTSDGGYIIAGRTLSYGAGSYDVYLIKTDANGNSLWEKTFGGADHDYGESVQQTSDGGYIIAGRTLSFQPANSDVYLVKTDPDGNLQWEKIFGGGGYDHGYSVRQTSDGGYIIAGIASGEDAYLIKTKSNGDITWDHTYGGVNKDSGLSVCQTQDNGYIVTGVSYNGIDDDVYIIKTDSSGSL